MAEQNCCQQRSTLRTTVGNTRRETIRNIDIPRQCQIEDVVKFVRKKNKKMDDYINRTGDYKLIKIVKDSGPVGKRNPWRLHYERPATRSNSIESP